MAPRKILRYVTSRNSVPFGEWLYSLRDAKAIAAIDARLDRFAVGNFGDCRPVGAGVFELRVHLGPGYRVYFGQHGQAFVVLLCGGDKNSQRKDIQIAKVYWEDFRRRIRETLSGPL